MLPRSFHLTLDARLEGTTLLGGEPFALVRCSDAVVARIRAWQAGAEVGSGGALARTLVRANLAQPVPPKQPLAPVTAVVPVRDRSIATLLAALDVAEVIVVDDASNDGAALRAEAEAAGARYLRRAERGGAAAARNTGLAAASHELVACVDSDCVPRPGWLEAVLPHFADPEVDAVAPRIVALDEGRRREGARGARAARGEAAGGEAAGGEAARGTAARGAGTAARGAAHRLAGAIARYEAARSPLDRGPDPARVVPYGRVPFVPGAALVVRRHLRFDETLQGGEDVEFVWRVPYVRYEPAGQVAHAHRTQPTAWLARRAYYGRTAANIAKRHPGRARPLNVSLWTTAAWAAVAARRPFTALAITAAATALLAKELREYDLPALTAIELAGLGTLRSGRVIADALTRHWWPLSAAAAVAVPKARAPLAAALMTKRPLELADDLAYGAGLWRGCVEQRELDPLLPARPWRLRHSELS
jgi:glycosyltransferase involved in cell wall biosynthesis